MPREQITRGRITRQGDSDVYQEQPRRHLHIGWNKQGGEDGDGWVQLSTDVTIAELRSMLASAEQDASAEWAKTEKMAADSRALPGGAQIETLDQETFVAGHAFRVVGEVLSRAEVNRLVQLSRKARDDAYGRDA